MSNEQPENLHPNISEITSLIASLSNAETNLLKHCVTIEDEELKNNLKDLLESIPKAKQLLEEISVTEEPLIFPKEAEELLNEPMPNLGNLSNE